MTQKQGKEQIERLTDDFYQDEKIYLSKDFQETEARTRFIDPFFSALGWELNQTGISRAFWDVHREFSQRDDSSTKKPDYAFRKKEKNGFQVKFFVEAKAPWVPLTDEKPVFQAKRYAFSTHGKTPIVILTDFEEFRVFNAAERPRLENPLQGLIKDYDIQYTDYAAQWDKIYGMFSKEAVYNGSIDALAQKTVKVKKTLDDEFLNDISEWRETLARNIAIRNKNLTIDELNEAVQRILDRLIFIRNLEDREIEDENLLLNLVARKDDENAPYYRSIVPVFRRLDGEYNGLLFKKHFSEDLQIDNKTVKELIRNMCYPVSPFQFDIIEPEILGRIYERFLGSKIRLTETHQAKVEEKPEVRKAGGVYYTPEYIVKYIVENTVGEMLRGGLRYDVRQAHNYSATAPRQARGDIENFMVSLPNHGMTPEEIDKLKICDPACGSGSFLLGAYSRIAGYLKKWYAGNKAAKKYKDDFYTGADGEIRLSLQKKGAILKNNLYGVDIDPEAVEVAIMSLYLKILDEGFDKGQALLFLKGHILPDMTGNIKCGNSLIGSDFYEDKETGLFPREERKHINAFDWGTAFPGVFATAPPPLREDKLGDRATDGKSARGDTHGGVSPDCATDGISNRGFDVVIGNPPYVRQELLTEKGYFQKKYEVYNGVADLYSYFIERGYTLLGNGGLFGIIVSNKWMRANYGQSLRKWMKTKHIREIVDFGDLPVFENATTYPCILSLSKSAPNEQIPVTNVKTLDFADLKEYTVSNSFTLERKYLADEGWTLADKKVIELMEKIKSRGVPLEKYVDGKIYRGVLTGLNEAFVIDGETRERLIAEDPKSAEVIKPFLLGRDIKRYQPAISDKYLILFPKGWTNENSQGEKNKWDWLSQKYPAISAYLKPHESAAKKRCDQGDYWWELRACDYYEEFEKPKIMYAEIASRGQFVLDSYGFYSDTTSYIMASDSLYLLSILNSWLFTFYFSYISSTIRGGYYRWKFQYIALLPIYKKNEKSNEVASLVEQMLAARKALHEAKSERDKEMLEREAAVLDGRIDKLVYELYGLTEEEIRIVESK
jgi:type I restriction-modification system DNA methylase subunit